MKRKIVLPLIGMMAFLLGACGEKGDTGPQGEQGVPGQNGQDGAKGDKGDKGADGTSVLTGSGAPSASLGKDGDSYIDLDTWDYYVKENGSWSKKGNLKGSNGQDGTSMLSGSGEPASSLGKDGDSYIDIATWNYYVKENGTWVLKGNIKGADVDVVYHTVSFDSNGGDQTYESQTIKHGEKVSKPTDPTRFGYEFLYWSYQGEVWSFVGHSVTENMTLTANWSEIKYDLSVTSNDEDKGRVVVNGGGHYMEEITVTANPIGTNVFVGWYSEDEFVSNSNPFTFTMPTNDYSLVAHFIAKEEADELYHLGGLPTISNDGKTVTYGLYPQTNVSDSEILAALNALESPERNDWYLYNGDYYAKAVAAPYSDDLAFSNDSDIVSGSTYWFKCEPISWKVLNNTDGVCYLLSNIPVESLAYHHSTDERTIDGNTIYANNYEYSDIRSWLIGDFYNAAFTFGNTYIETTIVDNSAATTRNSNNQYACRNTEDKVFLPSYKDYVNPDYGFETTYQTSGTRSCLSTDWVRAKGARTTKYGSYPYCCDYWTRTPASNEGDSAAVVGYDGWINNRDISKTFYCVRPAITIKIA